VQVPEPQFVQDEGEEEEEERERGIDISIAPSVDVFNEQKTDAPRQVRPAHDPARAVIARHMRDLAREMGDAADLWRTTARAVNLYRRSGLPLPDFLSHLQAARAVTWEHSASIRHIDDSGRKTRVPYLFAVLEDVLDTNTSKPPRTAPPAGRTSAPIPPPALLTNISHSPQSWPAELVERGIPDPPAFIRAYGRGPFLDPATSVEYARRHQRL
jgi:hypothetical protein